MSKCIICHKSKGMLLRRQISRPSNPFFYVADENGFVSFHHKCLMDYQRSLEEMV